jgi:arylsulfatase A-like enzyme
MPSRNILVVLCDQLRPDFLPAYGCDAVPTPNLDRLADAGVVFENAITQSTVCGPARATMMTGRYVSDHGSWTNDVPTRDGLTYLPERMNEAGYATGAFGKLHSTPPDDARGFQETALMEEGRLGDAEPYLSWLRDRRPDVDGIWNHEEYTFAFDGEEYYERWIASRAIEFLEDRGGDDDPFLAWVSFQGPHTPLDPPPEVKGTVDTERLPAPLERPDDDLAQVAEYRKARGPGVDSREEVMARRTAYAELIVEIDRQIGRILDRLEALDAFEETTIVFAADHGDLLGDFGLWAKGPFPYRGQLDVPMIVANHPDVRAGTRSDRLVGTIDLPGTCLDLAGAGDGIGVSRSLLEEVNAPEERARDVVFSEFCDSIKTAYDGRYLYSYYPFTGRGELYDRENDPDERRDLAGTPEHATTETRMLKHLIDVGILAKGVRVEAQDFVPDQQAGVRRKHPDFDREFEVAYPLSAEDCEKLRDAGLSAEYNEFCRGQDPVANYADPYWIDGE